MATAKELRKTNETASARLVLFVVCRAESHRRIRQVEARPTPSRSGPRNNRTTYSTYKSASQSHQHRSCQSRSRWPWLAIILFSTESLILLRQYYTVGHPIIVIFRRQTYTRHTLRKSNTTSRHSPTTCLLRFCDEPPHGPRYLRKWSSKE